jgi:hypothetical protein
MPLPDAMQAIDRHREKMSRISSQASDGVEPSFPDVKNG